MATKTAKGLAVRSIRCAEQDTVRVDVHDLDTFTCSSCDAEFTADDVRTEIARWGKLLAWIESAPEAA